MLGKYVTQQGREIVLREMGLRVAGQATWPLLPL